MKTLRLDQEQKRVLLALRDTYKQRGLLSVVIKDGAAYIATNVFIMKIKTLYKDSTFKADLDGGNLFEILGTVPKDSGRILEIVNGFTPDKSVLVDEDTVGVLTYILSSKRQTMKPGHVIKECKMYHSTDDLFRFDYESASVYVGGVTFTDVIVDERRKHEEQN